MGRKFEDYGGIVLMGAFQLAGWIIAFVLNWEAAKDLTFGQWVLDILAVGLLLWGVRKIAISDMYLPDSKAAAMAVIISGLLVLVALNFIVLSPLIDK